MIARYSREQMTQVWSDASRFSQMLRVEIECQRQLAKTQFSAAHENVALLEGLLRELSESSPRQWIENIRSHETITRHETLAFLHALEEMLPGLHTHLLHLGLTSSDILDTALALQLKEAGILLLAELDGVITHLERLSKQHSRTLMCGRTHGMVAEPTTFGFKLAGFAAELRRHLGRLERALDEVSVGKISGAVGTAQFFGPAYEAQVLQALGLRRETFSTQVVSRDRHAEFMSTLAGLAGGIERLSIELRHLQRSEVGELHEGFALGQTGSSAMPHKKNPISSENLTGCARLMRSYAFADLKTRLSGTSAT